MSQDAEKERQRILAEIARDKELRKQNKGVLPSVLGADGYNPSGVQYEVDSKDVSATSATATGTASATDATPKPTSVPAKKPATASTGLATLSSLTPAEKEQKIDAAIATLMKYRTAGDGGHALKLLLTFVKNVNDQPQEPKYVFI